MRLKSTLFLACFSLACSQEPTNAGLCALSCDGAIIGPVEAQIETVFSPGAVTCSADLAGQPVPEPVLAQFSFLETVNDDGAGKSNVIPLPSVSFEPVISGPRSPLEEHNPNVEINNGVFTPVRYKGIVTPSSNWCTDSCGVAAVEVVPLCPPAGGESTISISIHSGAKFSEPIELSIETQSPEG